MSMLRTSSSPETVSVWRRLFRHGVGNSIAAVSRLADDHVQGWPTTEMIGDDERLEARAWADTEWADTQPSDFVDL